MLRKLFVLFLMTVAIGVITSTPVLAADKDKSHEGTVVSVADGKLTMTLKGEEKKHSHNVANDAKITLDGKEAKLADLKEGFQVTVTTDENNVATKIDATSKAK